MAQGVPDLTPVEVAALAAAYSMRLAGEDLTEVTHRLNAMRDALAPLAELALEHVSPAPPSPDA
jgi:hypothetical protein